MSDKKKRRYHNVRIDADLYEIIKLQARGQLRPTQSQVEFLLRSALIENKGLNFTPTSTH